MAQLIHILVASRSIPEPEEPGQAVADGVQVIIQQARPTGRLQGKPVGLVLNKGLNTIGFNVGKDLQLPRLQAKALGLETFLQGYRQVEGVDGFRKG
jgi:hypothetical protein